MKVIAIVMAILILLGYVSNIKVVFKSPRKMEDEFKANMEKGQKQNGKSAFNAGMAIGVLMILGFVVTYFTLTASVTGSMFMTLTASIFIVYELGVTFKMMMYLTEQGDYRIGIVNKIFTFAEIAYLIAFFILIL